jgi:DNA polymerase III subunit gamma/tau
MSWPLKHRPRQLEDLALLDVRTELLRLVGEGELPQAFLFAGPKGSGKTSASRIISVILNDELDDEEKDKIFAGNSYIINEMDAASNRGIDDIRSLKEKISLPPQLGKKSVYILDEAHMLTKEAFNALLKVLEEPPAHVVFILATTELHKIPDTIVSRCNLINFRKAHSEELGGVLKRILKAEKKEIEDEVLNQVIARSGGSFRDAVKMLEAVGRGVKKITLKDLGSLGDLKLEVKLSDLVGAVLEKDEKKVVEIIAEFRSKAIDVAFVYQELLSFLHQDLLKAMDAQEGEAQFSQKISLFLLKNLQDLPSKENGLIPFLALEIKLLELIFKSKDQAGKSKSTSTPVAKDVKKNSPELKSELVDNFEVVQEVAQNEVIVLADKEELNNLDEASAAKDAFDKIIKTRPIAPPNFENFKSDNLVDPEETNYASLCEVWDDFLGALENKNLTLAAIIKSSKLMPDSNGVTRIGVFYKFHKMQLEENRLLSILQSCGEEVAGGMPKFEFVLLSESEKVDSEKKKEEFKPTIQGLEKDVTEALM